jgi:predicted O-linked N-acetylglucosamine transferase (SPINDLY family)
MARPNVTNLLVDAVEHHRAGRLEAAEGLYARARAAAPTNFDALHLSGLVAQQQHRHRDAAELLRRALRLNPTSAICEMRLGAAHSALGDFETAEKRLRRAILRSPAMPEAWCHLGVVLGALGQTAAERSAFERAIELKPDFAEAIEHLGALVSRTDGFAASVPHLRKLVELRPENPTALANLGIALAQSSGGQEALRLLERAIELDPGHSQARTGRAFVLQGNYRIAEAVSEYGVVLARDPGHNEARSARLLALHYLDGVSREQLHAEHAAFGDVHSKVPARVIGSPGDPGRRLRVGFLSPDLRAHSVAYFLKPMIEHLDPAAFEVFLYHDHPRVDAMSAQLRAHAAQWRNFAGQTANAAESAIRGDSPDVLIDLAGHTGFNRLALFARRLAPIQATYLGYPDTTGLEAMDYRLVDPITDPPGDSDRFHSEKLLRFSSTAWSYGPPATAPEVAPPPSAGGSGFTFGCFNNFAKVSDSTLRGWAGVLASVPGSRIILKGHGLDEPGLAPRLRARLELLGVGEESIELQGRTPNLASHLGLYSRVDVALDTFPYNGTTTTCEAIWMGVPVVTLAGDRHASRVGASLLSAAGHPEWIARDWNDYARIALGLASDPQGLAARRTGLRAELMASVLMDHAGQAAKFGAALRQCWRNACRQ